MLDEPEFARWLSSSAEAFDAAGGQAGLGHHNWACFLAEQSAQLAVKGLLHGTGSGAWGHDLVELGRRAGSVAQAIPGDVNEALVRLARHYIPTRYPDANPGGTPGQYYLATDSGQARDDAACVRHFVEEAWRQLGEGVDGGS
ncbi:HEPN domain-containing protein [soil metagenome]